jgi:amino acid transporter
MPDDRGHGFGTLPVFLAGISTILGAVMFLRFGYAVGHAGLLGALGIVALGHLVTIPTALALSEIATNRKVEGGGEYYVISRSFGIRIGAAIGLSLYLSQAISVAFYIIAFGEAFESLGPTIETWVGRPYDARMISIPSAVLLGILMLTKGASVGIKALYVVVSVLAVSLLLFFLGSPVPPADGSLNLTAKVADNDAFFIVFAIVFPSFTGMTAGVGLSGDLEDPGRSIPRGTVAATLVGLLVYVFIAWKLAVSAPPELLAEDQMVMAQIAIWGPIIPVGLACATLSSAIGSFLVAPRTLQALARDGCFVPDAINSALSRGVGEANEPRAATSFTLVFALVVIALGNVDLVARLISMFFMVTYGALCSISFLEHFAANPDYRPTFRSRWYLSFTGAVMCGLMMFLMDPLFATLAVGAMVGFYWLTRFTRAGTGDDVVALFLGVMSQSTRRLQLRLQQRRASNRGWRPSVVAINPVSLTEGVGALRLLGWICERYGVGTYIQVVHGRLGSETHAEAQNLREHLIELTRTQAPSVYVETMVSPSLTSAMAQILQMPGVSGLRNNSVLLEYGPGVDAPMLDNLLDDAQLAVATGHNVLFLRDDGSPFKTHRRLDVWLTWHDETNAKLMLVLAYIISGHRDWADCELRVFAALPDEEVAPARERFGELCRQGRIPIPERNIRFLAANSTEEYEQFVAERSGESDLVIIGMTEASLNAERGRRLEHHPSIAHALFVLALEDLEIE